MTRGCETLLWVAALFSMGGCSQADRFVKTTDSIVRLSPGIPYFELQTRVVWRDSIQGVEVNIGRSNRSLVFVQEGTGFRSILDVDVRILDRNTGKQVMDREWSETTFVTTYAQSRSMEARRFSKFLPVSNNSYTLVASLTDRFSGKRLAQRQDIDVATDRFSVASAVVMSKRGAEQYMPLFLNHVVGQTDSVLFNVVLNTPRAGRFCEAELRMVQYPTDNAPAVPPHYFTGPMNPTSSRGVDYTRGDTVLSSAIEWITEDRQADVSLPLGTLSPGYYRVIVALRIRRQYQSPRARTMTLTRDVVAIAPLLSEADQTEGFVEPLVYIASLAELKGLRAASTPEDRMKLLQEFWLAPSRSSAEAAQFMNMYYSRVEEANWFFTNHKEGWKTDQGMIYIVHGPPGSITREGSDTEVWQYPDRGVHYVFSRRVQQKDDVTFPENYVLVRTGSLSAPPQWLKAIKEWRGGVVPFGLD